MLCKNKTKKMISDDNQTKRMKRKIEKKKF